MVKLVTSRVHRCYSALGSSRSARHERINDCIHVAAISLMLLSVALELNQVAAVVKLDRHKVALVGAALLILIQLFDLFAASNAHRIHYAPPRHSSKSSPFRETPTKVDALVCTLCLLGALATLASSKLNASAKSEDIMVGGRIAVIANTAFMAAAFVNTVFSIPSLVVKVPPPLARAHNAVTALFLAGATGNAVVTLANVIHDKSIAVFHPFMTMGALLAYATIWIGAILNVARTGALLQIRPRARGREAMSSDDGSVKSRSSPSGGIFSWFKNNKSDNGVESEYDSDDIDEEEGFSSEEELYTRRKTRR